MVNWKIGVGVDLAKAHSASLIEEMDEGIIQKTIVSHLAMIAQFEQKIGILSHMAKMIIQAFRSNGTLYLCGNGGSAADAQHVAGEFVGRFQIERKPLPAVALSTNTSVLTCIANDYDYENVFARQVEALIRPDDVLWVFSTSGASPNILRAVEVARAKGACVIAFTGREKSALEAQVGLCLCAASTSTARSQEIHQLAYHIVCDLVERSFVG
jgi:D-sedoheptulose 7-phosphate isomerase